MSWIMHRVSIDEQKTLDMIYCFYGCISLNYCSLTKGPVGTTGERMELKLWFIDCHVSMVADQVLCVQNNLMNLIWQPYFHFLSSVILPSKCSVEPLRCCISKQLAKWGNNENCVRPYKKKKSHFKSCSALNTSSYLTAFQITLFLLLF